MNTLSFVLALGALVWPIIWLVAALALPFLAARPHLSPPSRIELTTALLLAASPALVLAMRAATTAMAALILGEKITATQMGGAALVIAGVMLVSLRRQPPA